MAEITVPASVVEEPLVSGGRDFPEGVWQGEIDETRVKDFPEWASNPTNNGYENAVGEVLGIQIGSATALEEGQDDPGNLKCFDDFVIQDGDLPVYLVDPDEDDVPHWRLQRAWRRLVQLAGALGATSKNGAGYSVDLEAFVEGLQSGVYDGAPIAFTTIHRPFTRKDGSKGVEVIVTQYMAAG